MRKSYHIWLPALFFCLITLPASAQSFRVQCPTETVWHPSMTSGPYNHDASSEEGQYAGPLTVTETKVPGSTSRQFFPPLNYTLNGGGIKCQQISGGDGFMTEADGNQTFMFSFGPLSGMDLIQHGKPGTQFAAGFNKHYNTRCLPGVGSGTAPNVNCLDLNLAENPSFNISQPISLDGAVVDPATIMNIGVVNGNIPAPLIAIEEDDELFLTLTNVGMIMRPDLFETHTVHFHGYPNASSYYDGVPDASLAVNIGGSFTYYYLAPDAGTYFWHCHITPPEHLQMGMVGQLYVRPRQNRVPSTLTLYAARQKQDTDLRTACVSLHDILCSNPLPAGPDNSTLGSFGTVAPKQYAYNDGDGSTQYDVDVPLQIHGFDPNFHFVGMTFNPEGFSDMKDKYFLLNGRSYPDTVGVPGYAGGPSNSSTNPDAGSNAIATEDSDGRSRYSQPMHSLITLHSRTAPRALLRISDLDVAEYQTLASLGIPMKVVGYNAKLLRDQDGNNLYYYTNSITLAGGESLDAILDATTVPAGTYFLYTPNLDHLSNDAENFGGLMTEIQVIND